MNLLLNIIYKNFNIIDDIFKNIYINENVDTKFSEYIFIPIVLNMYKRKKPNNNIIIASHELLGPSELNNDLRNISKALEKGRLPDIYENIGIILFKFKLIYDNINIHVNDEGYKLI